VTKKKAAAPVAAAPVGLKVAGTRRVRVPKNRIAGDEVSAEIIANAVARADRRTATAANMKRRKGTPTRLKTHAVRNADVHTQNSSARQVDTREEIDRDSERSAWQKPNALAAPTERPGFRQRWVRLKQGGAEDTDNLEKMLDQGWRPVKRSGRSQVHELTADSGSKYGQYYVKRGLILMQISEKSVTERNRHYREQQKRMNRGVDEDLFKLDNRYMPMLKPERRSKTQLRARRGAGGLEVPGDEARE
jgi:hypothetical protein